jgi:hypothetical protein
MEIVPPDAPSRIVQVTDVSLAPVTVAVNCWLPFVGRLTEEGDIVTETAANARDGARQRIAVRKINPACT